jgi:hypothetical protein
VCLINVGIVGELLENDDVNKRLKCPKCQAKLIPDNLSINREVRDLVVVHLRKYARNRNQQDDSGQGYWLSNLGTFQKGVEIKDMETNVVGTRRGIAPMIKGFNYHLIEQKFKGLSENLIKNMLYSIHFFLSR